MNGRCPIETTVSLINGKWKLLILKELSQGPVRYGQLGAQIPAVSAKVLTQQLREMEEDGLIVRTVFAEVPPRVEYSLADMGLGGHAGYTFGMNLLVNSVVAAGGYLLFRGWVHAGGSDGGRAGSDRAGCGGDARAGANRSRWLLD